MTHISLKQRIYFIFLVLLGGIVCSCANISYPSGGEKDTTPPVILKSVPENGTLNFSNKQIELTFDEYIELKNLEENFISSPPFENKPEISVSGKRLKFIFEDTLRQNTTYRIQFGNAIVDLNEGNPIPNFEYVFSTGDFIDSMAIKGKVQMAFDHSPVEKALVVLYPVFYDSIVSLEKPVYVSRTEKDGSFLLKNLKDTSYRIFALKDMNANLLYDLPIEEIGFLDAPVLPFPLIDSIPLDSLSSLTLNLFIPDDTTQRILSSDYIANGTVKIITKLPVEDLNFEGTPKEICYVQNNSKDTITIWLPPAEKDSVFLILKDAERIVDTIREKYYEDAVKKTTPKFFETNISSSFPYYERFTLDFSTPLLSIDSINVIGWVSGTVFDTIIDSIPTSITVFDTVYPQFSLKKEECSRSVIIDIEPEQGEEYSFILFGGKFTSIYGTTNDTTMLKTRVTKEDEYGIFKFFFEGKENSQYIVQLQGSNKKTIRENIIQSSDTILYEHLSPAEYKIKIIEDVNRNGKWDSGNYWEKIQPEPVHFFEKNISIRANWTQEESFKWNED